MHDVNYSCCDFNRKLIYLVIGTCLIGFVSVYFKWEDDFNKIIFVFLFLIFSFSIWKMIKLKKELMQESKEKVNGFVYLIEKIKNTGIDSEAHDLFEEFIETQEYVNSLNIFTHSSYCYRRACVLELKLKNYIAKYNHKNAPS